MQTPAVDLFGEVVEQKEFAQKNEPFSLEAVDAFIHGDLFDALFDELVECLECVREERLHAKTQTKITFAKQRLWENFMWVFELHQLRPGLPFSITCQALGVDQETICSGLSVEFGAELREFYAAYANVQPVDAIRIARLLRQYVDLSH